MHARSGVSEVALPDGTLTREPLVIANTFNNYFSSVFTNDDGNNPVISSKTSVEMPNIEFTPDTVFLTLLGLKSSLSAGPDGIPNLFLKNCASTLATPLSHIFDVSFKDQKLPLGSVLEPTLFLLYINDLPSTFANSDTICKLFADDVKLYNKSPSQLQYSLDRIVEWSEKWQLQLAPDKCQILSLIECRRSFNPCEYWINSHRLTRADLVRDLGVLIDFSLHFDKHIDNIIKKASNVSKLILLSFSTRDQNILMKAFCTYVRPILEYSCPVWSPHRKSLIDRIEKIQKRFTSVPSSLHAKTETTQTTFHRKTSFAG